MQPGFFDLDNRLEQLEALGDPLPKLSRIVDWEDKPSMLRQKDLDARWTKKHGQTHYGYKNHVSIDRKHKLIRHFEVTDAAVADTHVFDELIDPENTSADIWADAAYRSKARERILKDEGYRSHIHSKGQVNKPISVCQQRANRRRSKVRCRVEHVFAAQQAMGGKLVRTRPGQSASEGGADEHDVQPAPLVLVGNGSGMTWLFYVAGKGNFICDRECCSVTDKDRSDANFRKASSARMPAGLCHS